MDHARGQIVMEVIDFGSNLNSSLPLYQYESSLFHSKCLQVNSQVNDSTGLRLHGGAHVAVRMIYHYLNYKLLSVAFETSELVVITNTLTREYRSVNCNTLQCDSTGVFLHCSV